MAKSIFLVKIFRGEAFKTGVIAQTIRSDMRTYSRKVIESLEETTENWQHAKPTFEVERTRVAPSFSQKIELTVGLGGSKKGQKKWVWLNEGTDVRHAVMSKDFRPKTRVGTTKTGSGHPPYKPEFVSKAILMPGIEAREWTRVITNRHMKGRGGVESFSAAMQKALNRGLARMNADSRSY